MAITTDQKIDFLWKKIGYKAAKTDLSSVKGGPNEAIPAVSRINSSVIWAQSGDIPAVQPSASAGVVTIYADSGGTATVETTADATSTAQRSWKTGLTDWIDTSYGSTYLVKVYSDSASSTTPESTGTQLLGGEGGYEWYFDYDSGVVHFIGTSIPASLSGKVIYVKGSRYTGNTGVPTSGSGSTSTNVQFDPTNLNDIQSTDTDGNINLDPNGDGQVVIEGTNSAVMPVGTTAQRGTATQGGIRYNTDTTSFEGYSGSDWAGMGGLIDIDQDTHICAEVTSDADELIFTTGGVEVAQMAAGEIVFNDAGNDQDFRVESDTSNKAFFVSGYGTGKVGIGTTAPNDQFEVSSYPDDTYIRIQTAANKNTGVRFFNTGNNYAIINDGCGVYADTDSFIIHDSTANAARLEVKTSGAINIAGALTAGSVTSTGILATDSTTNATTGTDGALQTDGGLSVVCDGFIGGSVTAGSVTSTGRLVTDNTTNATTTTDGSLQTDGGLSVVCDGFIGGALTATGRIVTDSTTNATSTTDGSLQTDGGLSVACDLYIGGDFTVVGSTFTIDSTTLTVADKNIDLGSVATPTDGTADGGGITLKGTTDKTILWTDSQDAWVYNQGITVGVDDTGHDVKFFGATAGKYLLWDESEDKFHVRGQTDDIIAEFDDGTNSILKIETEAVVINDGSRDTDFRVENNDDAYALFVHGYGGTGVVGVGTGAPNDKLDVTDWSDDSWVRITATSGNKNSGVRLWGDRNWQLLNNGSGLYSDDDSFVIHDATDNVTRLLILPNGYVGIGGDFTPDAQLHVKNDSSSVYTGHFKNGNGTAPTLWVEATGNDANDTAVFKVDVNSATRFMVSNEDGNVGIGTSTPGNPLHVYKGGGNLYGEIETTDANAAGMIFKNSASEWQFYNKSTGNFVWYNASGANISITPAGILGVGTDSALANTMFEIKDATNASLLLHDSDATSTKRIVEIRSQGEEFFIQGRNDTNTGGGAVGTFITSSLTTGATQINNSLGVGTAGSGTAGEIRATNEITAYYSDARLKDVQGPILDALNKVDQLTGYRYKGNETAVKLGYTDDKQQVGLMAQDVQGVVPEAVTLAPIDINLDGSSKSGENYLTIKYEKLIPLLVNAIKELRQEVDDLKALI